jgi:uncharacterized protein (TIGR02246 family)
LEFRSQFGHAPHQLWNPQPGQYRRISKANRLAGLAIEALDTRLSRFDLLEDFAGIDKKHRASRSEGNAARVTFEQLQAEFLFKAADLSTQGGLGDAQSFGRSREIENLGGGDKASELANIHRAHQCLNGIAEQTNPYWGKEPAPGMVSAMKTITTPSHDAVAALILRYGAELNRSNTPSIVSLYTDDGVFMPAGAPTASGPAQLHAAYNAVFATIKLAVEFGIEEIEVHGDIAFARTTSRGKVTVLSNSHTQPEENRELFILRRVEGRWMIAIFSTSPDADPSYQLNFAIPGSATTPHENRHYRDFRPDRPPSDLIA